jgi:hypothetical protein
VVLGHSYSPQNIALRQHLPRHHGDDALTEGLFFLLVGWFISWFISTSGPPMLKLPISENK